MFPALIHCDTFYDGALADVDLVDDAVLPVAVCCRSSPCRRVLLAAATAFVGQARQLWGSEREVAIDCFIIRRR